MKLLLLLLVTLSNFGIAQADSKTPDGFRLQINYGEKRTDFEVKNSEKGASLNISLNSKSVIRRELKDRDFKYLISKLNPAQLKGEPANDCDRSSIQVTASIEGKPYSYTGCLFAHNKSNLHLRSIATLLSTWAL